MHDCAHYDFVLILLYYTYIDGPGRAPSISCRPMLDQIDHIEGNGKVVKVVKSVAGKWEGVAVRLYFNNHDIERIKRDNHHLAIPSCRTMFAEWLAGEVRQPVNWVTLIKVLEEAEFSELASNLQVVLRS